MTKCCFYLVNSIVSIGVLYVMYGFVLVPDCTIHFINVLNTERAKIYTHGNKLGNIFSSWKKIGKKICFPFFWRY